MKNTKSRQYEHGRHALSGRELEIYLNGVHDGITVERASILARLRGLRTNVHKTWKTVVAEMIEPERAKRLVNRRSRT